MCYACNNHLDSNRFFGPRPRSKRDAMPTTESTLELFNRYPAAQNIAHRALGNFPTPVERLQRLGEQFGLSDFYIKRDDISGPLYGGNKVRKLEFVLADAIARGYDKVWTVGAIGSHHVLATSIYARHVGLQPAALHYPQTVTAHVLDVLKALSTTQPELTLVDHVAQIPVFLARAHLKEWLAKNPDIYYIPGGGSSFIGTLGYVNAALELKAQIERGELPEPHTIFVAAGTCGTLAGLILGAKMAGLNTNIIGVRVVDKIIANTRQTAHLANRCALWLEESGLENIPRITHKDVTILDGYIGKGYGEPTPQGSVCERLALDLENLEFDPTYTSKVLAAIVAERDRLELNNRPVLYWHTLNSIDLGERIRSAQPAWDLPAAYQKFF